MYRTLWVSSPHAGSSLAHDWLQLIQEDGGRGVVPGQLKQDLQTYNSSTQTTYDLFFLMNIKAKGVETNNMKEYSMVAIWNVE